MASQFEQVIEEQLNRFTRNGLLCGDLVKIKQEAFTSPWAKTQTVDKINLLKELATSGDYLRVSHIKSPYGFSLAGKDYEPDAFYVDITREIAPGLFTDVVTLPSYLVELIMTGGENRTQTPINPKLVRPNNEIIKPQPVQPVNSTAKYMDTQHPNYPVVDAPAGNNDPGNIPQTDKNVNSLPTSNTTLPGAQKHTLRYTQYLKGY
jgi:hypothetical protein